jgi:hypothetical protein
MSDWTKYAPWIEARQLEDAVRDATFLVEREEICGVEVLSMNWRHYLLLSGIGSPFLCGGTPLPGDVPRFLWVLSPEFTTDTRKRDKFIKRCRPLLFDQACDEIARYVEDTFQDSPEAAGDRKTPVVGQLAGAVDLLAHEYGWTEGEILRIPLKRVFQYMRCIIRRHDPQAIFINRSDTERRRWLKDHNGQN